MAGPISRGISAGEEAARAYNEAVGNMTGSLTDIAKMTGGPSQFDAGDIPSVGYLANLKANLSEASKLRESNATRQLKGIPSYTQGYRAYLKWRYPSRYGGGSGSSSGTISNPNSLNPNAWQNSIAVGDITSAPGYGG